MSANMASIGFAFPASLAEQLVYPDRQVICVNGDGGFGQLMADFTTAVREELPVARAHRITTPDGLNKAFKEGFKLNKPVLFDILVDPEKMSPRVKSAN